MNIIAGQKRGAKLVELSGRTTRPTAQRTREAIFNLLMGGRFGRNLLHSDTVILDLCAGTGALALEALSRGAGYAYLVEQDKHAAQVISQNIEKLGYSDKTTVLKGDVTAPLSSIRQPADILFCDPPYGSGLAQPAIEQCFAKKFIADGALIIIEARKGEAVSLNNDCELLDSRNYGIANISLFKAH